MASSEGLFDSIESAISDFRKSTNSAPFVNPPLSIPHHILTDPGAGEFLIVLDSPSRENEGDLIIAARSLTPRKAAFLIHHTSGYLCAPMPASRAAHLDLAPMVPSSANTDPNRTAYTVTVDAAEGVTTGISAADRALTCRRLADPGAEKDWFRRPGHVVPLRAVDGGVRARQGHTEAAVELCRLAFPEEERVGVIAELVEEESGGSEERREEGEGRGGGGTYKAERSGTGMMKRDDCLAFGRKFGIKVITIEDLVRHVTALEG